MRETILVASPHQPFGELLRGSLQDSRRYQVRLVRSAKEARDAIHEFRFDLAILDSSLPDELFVPLCLDVIAQQQGILLMVIPPDNNPNHPSLAGLMPHGYVHRPFYLPDLLENVARLLEQRDETQALPIAPRSELAHWLEDPALLRPYLEDQISSTQAQAAIVAFYRPGHETNLLRAYAGPMDEPSAQEFAAIVFRYWNRGDKTDLMRFVRLSASKRDYLVYATQITGDLVLILAYDNSIPMSQIRPQTRALATALAMLPPKDETEKAKPQAVQENADLETASASAVEEACVPAPAARTGDSAAAADDELEGVEMINLSSLLGLVPSPDPEPPAVDVRLPNNGWVRGLDVSLAADLPHRENGTKHNCSSTSQEPLSEKAGKLADQSEEDSIAAETRRMQSALASAAAADSHDEENVLATGKRATAGSAPEQPSTGASKPAYHDIPTRPIPAPLEPQPPVAKPHPVNTEATQKSTTRTDADLPTTPNPIAGSSLDATTALSPRPPSEIEEEEAGSIEPARSNLLTTYNHLNQLEPVSPGVSLLNYTCVLVPRLPHHYLTGSLADLLSGWVQQLCLAFGWRLEGLSIRPEYLQWTVQVAPSVSPGNLVKIMRQRTSMHIFNSFVHIREQNPSGDFWAVGYLIVSGTQPPSPQLLRDYIVQTRKRQGISR